MNVSIDELVAVVDVKLASLVGRVGGAVGCCRCRPAGGALYLGGVVKTSLTVGVGGFRVVVLSGCGRAQLLLCRRGFGWCRGDGYARLWLV